MSVRYAGQEDLTKNTAIQVANIEDEILAVRPAETMLTTELMAKNKVKTDSYEFTINEQNIDPGAVTIVSIDAQAKTVTLDTDEGDYIRAGQTLTQGYGVGVLAKSVSGDVVTVDSVTGLVQGKKLVLGGTGFEELSDRPAAVSRIPDQITNYVETMRDVSGQSTHVESTRFYGPSRQYANRDDRNWEHKRFIDRELFLGKKAKTTGTKGNTLYKTNGLLHSISTNVHEFSGGIVTWDAMQTNLVQDTRFMQASSINLYTSRKGKAILEKIVRDKTVPSGFKEAAGISVPWIELMGKRLNIMIVDHLEASSDLEKLMFLVDMSMVEVVCTANVESGKRNWMLETTVPREVNSTGADGTIAEIYSAFGLRLRNEKAHAIWYNANTASTAS